MKLKILFFAIVFLTILFSAYSQECSDFKNGTFKLIDKYSHIEYLIVRTDSIQKETNLTTNESNVYKVEWVSDCKFYLTMTEGTKEELSAYKGKRVEIEIIKCFEDSYRYSVRFEGYGQMKYQLMEKVGD